VTEGRVPDVRKRAVKLLVPPSAPARNLNRKLTLTEPDREQVPIPLARILLRTA
jgi:hypothetical protein